jgi:hypothetical protein
MLTLAVSILTSAQAERQDQLSPAYRQAGISPSIIFTTLFAGANIIHLLQTTNKVF